MIFAGKKYKTLKIQVLVTGQYNLYLPNVIKMSHFIIVCEQIILPRIKNPLKIESTAISDF